MKKRFAAVLAAAAIVGATSAFAANPFSDVTPSDWAYQAVSQLASAGIINGYPDGTFKGQRDVTRYEVAQMVAKAMAHEYRANAEQQALIGQLASEFAGELNNLGVRVDNVESKLGNVRIGGDARFQYRTEKLMKDDADKKDTYYQRMRLKLKANINEKATVNARVKYEFNYGEGGKQAKFDRLFFSQDLGKVNVLAGRHTLFIGNGLFLDDALDGVTATIPMGKATLTTGYGYETDVKVYNKVKPDEKNNAFVKDQTLVFGQLNAPIMKNVDLGLYAVGLTSDNHEELHHNVYGVTLDAQLADKLSFSGEYAKRDKNDDFVANKNNENGRDAWVAGLTYGNYNQAQKGTANIMLQYFREGENSPIVSTTYHQQRSNQDLKGWVVEGRYALAHNLGLSVFYSFDQKTIDGDKDYDNQTWARLDYKF